MKILLISLLLLVSCGKKDKNKSRSAEVVPPTELILNASRDYDPSVFNPQDKLVEGSGAYLIPAELEVISSQLNAGTGWASLTMAGRKFCYQGNASNSNTMDGSKFILRHESVLDQECSDNVKAKLDLDSEIALSNNSQVTLSVHGGGVSNAIRGFIEIEAIISPK